MNTFFEEHPYLIIGIVEFVLIIVAWYIIHVFKDFMEKSYVDNATNNPPKKIAEKFNLSVAHHVQKIADRTMYKKLLKRCMQFESSLKKKLVPKAVFKHQVDRFIIALDANTEKVDEVFKANYKFFNTMLSAKEHFLDPETKDTPFRVVSSSDGNEYKFDSFEEIETVLLDELVKVKGIIRPEFCNALESNIVEFKTFINSL